MNSVIPAIRDELIRVVVEKLMTKIIASSAFFALPFVNPITVFIVEKIVTLAVDETAIGLSLLWITVNIGYEVSSVEDATQALKKLLESPNAYSISQAQDIEAGFDSASRDLIKFSLTKL